MESSTATAAAESRAQQELGLSNDEYRRWLVSLYSVDLTFTQQFSVHYTRYRKRFITGDGQGESSRQVLLDPGTSTKEGRNQSPSSCNTFRRRYPDNSAGEDKPTVSKSHQRYSA